MTQSMTRLASAVHRRTAQRARIVRRAVAAGLLAGCGLGGCGMASLTSGIGGGVFGSPSPGGGAQSVTEEQLLTAARADEGASGVVSTGAVSAGCPRFIVWPRDNAITVYETGRVGDGLSIAHRGEITKTARECQVEPGRVTVKYGFSGRVLLGPKGKTGKITLPVNVYVTDAKRDKITGDTLKIDVDVAVENPISYFSAVKTVTFIIPEGSRPGEYEVFVGFDNKTANSG